MLRRSNSLLRSCHHTCASTYRIRPALALPTDVGFDDAAALDLAATTAYFVSLRNAGIGEIDRFWMRTILARRRTGQSAHHHAPQDTYRNQRRCR